jgi:hypothetical protein
VWKCKNCTHNTIVACHTSLNVIFITQSKFQLVHLIIKVYVQGFFHVLLDLEEHFQPCSSIMRTLLKPLSDFQKPRLTKAQKYLIFKNQD